MLIRVDRVAGGAGSAANTSMLPLTPVAPASSRAKRYVLCASWAPVPNPPGSKLGGYGRGGVVGSECLEWVPVLPLLRRLNCAPRAVAATGDSRVGVTLLFSTEPATQ